MDQRELVERAGRGDRDAFAVLVRGAIARLDAAARLILHEPELARDAVQAPDGRIMIVNNPASKETRIVDAATGGPGQVVPWSTGDLSGWQRLAP